MKPHYLIVITAIVCLTLMELAAMHYGINGTVRTVIFSMIAALAGITIPQPKFLKGGNEDDKR